MSTKQEINREYKLPLGGRINYRRNRAGGIQRKEEPHRAVAEHLNQRKMFYPQFL